MYDARYNLIAEGDGGATAYFEITMDWESTVNAAINGLFLDYVQSECN